MNQHSGDIPGLFGMPNFLDDKSATARENRRCNLSPRQSLASVQPYRVVSPIPDHQASAFLIRRCVQGSTYPSGRAHLSLLSYCFQAVCKEPYQEERFCGCCAFVQPPAPHPFVLNSQLLGRVVSARPRPHADPFPPSNALDFCHADETEYIACGLGNW
jgi:hypothetical protein